MSNLKDTIVLNGKETKLKATAFTALLYEDEFKGRCFLKDVGVATDCMLDKKSNFPSALCLRLLWATAKTANEKTECFVDFANNLMVIDIIKFGSTAIDLIWESIKTSETKEKN